MFTQWTQPQAVNCRVCVAMTHLKETKTTRRKKNGESVQNAYFRFCINLEYIYNVNQKIIKLMDSTPLEGHQP